METTTQKKAVERSRSYPSFPLDQCLELTTKIHTHYGNSRLSTRKEIADAAEMSEGYVVKFVSACVQFDLLEIVHGSGYKPSQTFVNGILLAENEEEKRKTLIGCLQKPPLYADILAKYKKLPAALPVILVKDFGIQLSVKDKAASVLTDSLKFVNVLSSDGTILIDQEFVAPAETMAGEEIPHTEVKLLHQPKPNGSQRVENATHLPAGKKRADIKINSARYVTLEFPEDINNQDIDKIIRNLETWKD